MKYIFINQRHHTTMLKFRPYLNSVEHLFILAKKQQFCYYCYLSFTETSFKCVLIGFNNIQKVCVKILLRFQKVFQIILDICDNEKKIFRYSNKINQTLIRILKIISGRKINIFFDLIFDQLRPILIH